MKSPGTPIAIGLAWVLVGPIAPCATQAQGTAPNPAATPGQPDNGQDAGEKSTAEGKALYQRECASCHGPGGKGDGPDAGKLKVRPTDLSSQEMWQKADAALYSRINEGKTPMPSFRSKLSKPEVGVLIKYIRTLAPKGSDNRSIAMGPQTNQPAVEPAEQEIPAKSGVSKAWTAPAQFNHKRNPVAGGERLATEGKEFYQQECQACHGSAGKGDGRNAKTLKVSPADLTSQNIRAQSDGALFWKINKGNPPMPSFRLRFSSHEIWCLVNYLRTLAPQDAEVGLQAAKRQGNQSPASKQGGAEIAATVENGGRTGEISQASNDPRATAKSNRNTWLRPEYFHVLINPLPIYGLAAAVLVLIGALILRNRPAQLLALGLVVFSAASALPTYWAGEKAYHRVYAKADADGQEWLDAHRRRAEKLIYVFYLLGVVALCAALIPAKVPKTAIPLAWLTLLIALGSLAAGGWIAKAGGQIRHPEFREARSSSGPHSLKTPN